MAKKKIGFFEGKFLPFHTGHMMSALQALNYVDELYVICCYNDKVDAAICQADNVREMPGLLRASWIGNELHDYPKIKVLSYKYDEDEYDFKKWVPWHRNNIAPKIDYVFSSEPSYSPIFSEIYPEAQHVILDEGRKLVPISATEIRKDIYGNWKHLPKEVRAYFVKKVLITGIESVGKSTMVHKLAAFFNTEEVQEVGRDYCVKYKNNLTADMFDDIAMKHYLKQKDILPQCNKLLFVDSDAVVTQYYMSKYMNGDMSLFVDSIIDKQQYDLIIYLDATVNWVDDGYRFLKHNRMYEDISLKKMYQFYHIDVNAVSTIDYQLRFEDTLRIIASHVHFEPSELTPAHQT
jgi:HTH-type transcriptional repressor of NAD biosynthesis genes